ncbi:hypothetical protein SAMN05421753_107194 [Planctomicrobium piriforme]|uniref:DUF4185 domain-containing protein n=2 Tax=Planctomicrobium piriforme TaxID=1576369 RepID=A0A1I3H052_9PLAN|nr:hypothetical protein SAMN05421753_107194 [Planctomicrobium piriforme]
MLLLLAVWCSESAVFAAESRFFAIRVIDAETGRGVPLVELETVNLVKFVTDSAGYVAFDEPGLMNHDVYFSIRSHGYSFPPDGFGYRGKKLHPTAGGETTLEVQRTNFAERLYRVTGGGIYRDSVLLKKPVPISQPVLNVGVLGSDSVLTAVFNGQIFWAWGDTQLPGYPLGLFQTPAAVSELPKGSLSPEAGVNLNYIVDPQGQAVNTAEMPGDGPTWLSGLTVLPGHDGKERLFAGYAKIKPPLTVHERGIVEFSTVSSRFEKRSSFPAESPLYPDGHPFLVKEGERTFIYFARPFPDVRVPANDESYLDLSQYEAWSYLKPGSTRESPIVDRMPDGRLNVGWKRHTLPRDWQLEEQLIQSGQLRREELICTLIDRITGKPVIAHAGSVNWNEFRHRYVMITCEVNGSSPLGEIWYSETATLPGPWMPAVKIVTHDNYSFYNPKHHPFFDQAGGRYIFFEGTYTQTFANNPVPTPRYDYNQIMYRLDLANPKAIFGSPLGYLR